MSTIEYIPYGEFKRLVEYTSTTLSIAVQQVGPTDFYVMAIDTNNKKAFTVRYNRENKARTWRIENLVNLLSEIGVEKFETRLMKKVKSDE